MVEPINIGGKIEPKEKESLTEIVTNKVKSNILSRMFFDEDMSQEGLQKVVGLLSLSNQLTESFSDQCMLILSEQISDSDNLDPKNIEELARRVANVFIQRLLTGVNDKNLIGLLEAKGHSELALDYKKTLYFSHNFSSVVKEMVRGELRNINQSETFYFGEDGKKSIAELGENEDEIVQAIENMFFTNFGGMDFDIQNLLNLNLLGFKSNALERAQEVVTGQNLPTRI